MRKTLSIQELICELNNQAADLADGDQAMVIMECEGLEFEIDKVENIEGEVLLIAEDIEDPKLVVDNDNPIEGEIVDGDAIDARKEG